MAAQASAEDANLDGWVPSLDHATFVDWNHVYEPSEDTFLLLDALFADRAALRASKTIVEIGPGSGVVATYLAKLTQNNVVAVDINEAACALTMRTADANGARVDVVRGDLCGALRSYSVDALVFNPPYVPTEDERSAVMASRRPGRAVVTEGACSTGSCRTSRASWRRRGASTSSASPRTTRRRSFPTCARAV